MKLTRSILLIVLCLCCLALPVSAEHYYGKEGWNVTFSADGSLQSNFQTSEYNDPIKGLEPGDDITFTVTLRSEYEDVTDWYMTNEVLHSLEDADSSATGGAYSYTLTYKGPREEKVLYTSDTVGGEKEESAGVGLHEATNALKEYFYLDSLEKGETATITLFVALEGESQGNRYQDTLADLQMNFAVELRAKETVVVTGDETNLLPWYLILLAAGIGVLTLGIIDLRMRKKGNRTV